jgi:Zn finger protein HypA/HybF involved in hydrogenase expression
MFYICSHVAFDTRTQGKVRGMRSVPECLASATLDVKTLEWTRGYAFPLDLLESRLRCPACGSRQVAVMIDKGIKGNASL